MTDFDEIGFNTSIRFDEQYLSGFTGRSRLFRYEARRMVDLDRSIHINERAGTNKTFQARKIVIKLTSRVKG